MDTSEIIDIVGDVEIGDESSI